MNKKGILFTFMTLLLLLNILGINSVIREQQFISKESVSEISALVIVNNKLGNILANVAELDEENKAFNQRILPFNYDVDGNTILVGQGLPVGRTSMGSYFDAINSLAIFVGDTNYENVFDGIAVDIDTVQNSDWDGSSNRLNFIVEPQCLKYTVDVNESLLGAGNCIGQFDIDDVLRYDLNITIGGTYTEDFNSVQCEFTGFIDCPDMDFNSSILLPFFELNFNDDNCSNCLIEESLKTIKGHYDSSYDNNITISCVSMGGVCNSTPIDVNVGEGMVISHSGNSIDITIGTTFKNPIDSFEFDDLNVSVSNSSFNIVGRRAR